VFRELVELVLEPEALRSSDGISLLGASADHRSLGAVRGA